MEELLLIQPGKMRLRKIGKYQAVHHDHVELWILRVLTQFSSRLYDPWDESDRDSWLEMADVPKQKIASLEEDMLKLEVEQRLQKIDAELLDRNGVLFTNINYLNELLSMSPVEKEIFTFAAIATRNHAMRKGLRMMSIGTREFAIQVLACVLELPEDEIREACQRKALLSTTGLLFHRASEFADAEDTLGLDDAIVQILFTEHSDRETFISNFFRAVPASSLEAEDYPHLKTDFKIITGYLRNASASKRCGVNILIYGQPGTGKTEFARLLATTLEANMYEVGFDSKDDDQPSNTLEVRLASYKMCQTYLARSGAGIVLFDEMEDIFPSEGMMMGGKRQQFMPTKASTNNMLESNPVPTIWVSNEVHYLDPAFLRRFDYALEMLPPPRSVRKKIIQRYMQDLFLPEECLERIAENEELTPAQVERAAKVARYAGISDKEEMAKAMDRIMHNSMNLMGQARAVTRPSNGVEFSMEFLNVSTDVEALMSGLKKLPSCRICFYGPPGTGKTSFGHQIAKSLDMPLMVRRASDLLGCYVGQTEANIAKMFRSAVEDGAVLLLDEADSFLQERKGANHSWEVTQVNELLTQMENFDGIFVCSTNLMESLDPASLRRFDFKVRFDYLTNEQRLKLFHQQLQKMGHEPFKNSNLQAAIDKLSSLTPGDFAVARKQFAVLGKKPTPEEFADSLAEECKVKPGVGKTMGFV